VEGSGALDGEWLVVAGMDFLEEEESLRCFLSFSGGLSP